jgi:serine/threonine protein kinase
LRANLPTMTITGPLRDDKGKVIAALGLRIRPEDQFTRILQVVRFGESGETYAYDKNGLLLSQSRFDEDLKQLGLLVDQKDTHSILTVEVRDPQVNMAEGERPKLRRSEQPLTRPTSEAVQGKNGHDADGYRDYRGVPSVGAWRWLPDYDFGITTEVDCAEAFQPVYILRRAFWSLMGLLGLLAVGIFVAMVYIARQQRALQKATLAAKQLGQYALEEKIGAGGMGTVYKARHAMLRRPTAVKLLEVEKMSDAAVARFEREVQLTSGLTHPNTVAVFDYGRTPDGIFYYAMEYLDGMNLDDLVKKHGALPEARMAFILRQVCGSLAEAHAAGLVHRDIKPANIFLTRRGGLHDFVKVLDFGLVKAIDGQDKANVTSPNAMMGTPLYLSPEAVNHPDLVDARADVYAVGAVGYFLLTGTPVFTGATIVEICMKHAKEAPQAPSARSGKPVSAALEALLLRCLAKAPSERPRDAAELLRELEACAVAGQWSAADAAVWWSSRDQAITRTTSLPPSQVQETRPPDSTVAYQEPAR